MQLKLTNSVMRTYEKMKEVSINNILKATTRELREIACIQSPDNHIKILRNEGLIDYETLKAGSREQMTIKFND